jgi:RNA polymerase sigma factor (sigma-70 family)
MSPWLSDLFLSSQWDERLLSLARAGHDQAFAAIVQRYRRQLHAAARRLSADGRAEDLVQQTFLSALAALRSGTEVRHLRGWLHQILRNVALRTPASVELDLDSESGHAATDSAQQVAERRMLAVGALSEVARLPRRQHEALVQTAIQGRSRSEVAGAMGLSEGAVRQLVHRARETLRSAATAITPYPVVRALTVARSPPASGTGLPEAAMGAGSLSAGGIAVKVGALVASGVVAAGIVSSGAHHAPPLVLDRHGAAIARRSGIVSGAEPLAATGGPRLLAEAGGALQVPTAARAIAIPEAGHRTQTRAHSGGSGDHGRIGGSGGRPGGNRGGDSSTGNARGSGGDQQSGGGTNSGGGPGPGSGGGGGNASRGGGGSSDGGNSGSGSSGSDGGSRPSGGQLDTGGGGMNSGGNSGFDVGSGSPGGGPDGSGGGSGSSGGGPGPSGGSGSVNSSGSNGD